MSDLGAVMPRSFRYLLRQFCRPAFMFAVLGCASIAPAIAAPKPSPDRSENLRAQYLRVVGVAYRLSIANARLCPNSMAPQLGFNLQSVEHNDATDWPKASNPLRLRGNVGVVAVVAGSPAHRSGLAEEDQLISVNGRTLSVAGATSEANRTRARLILSAEMAKGEVVLSVLRTAGLREVRFTAEPGCVLDVELVAGGEVNAWADGHRVVVSEGIIARSVTDADLALVIAHELAHNLLHHGERQAAADAPGRQLRLTGTALAGRRENEEEADRLGVRLANAAAYDLRNTPFFLSALLNADGPGATAGTHPATARRLALLRSEIAAVGPNKRNSLRSH